MQERHDNDETEPHNHNEYPLLYKEAKISLSVIRFGQIFRVLEVLHITCNMCTRDLHDSHVCPRASDIHIRQIPRDHHMLQLLHVVLNVSCQSRY